MTFRVVVLPVAEQDLLTAGHYIRNHSQKAARDWLRRVRQSIKTLSQFPERCHLAPESASFQKPIRELLFGAGNRGTYRILFSVVGKTVLVLHVRHGSMLPLEPEE